LSAPIGVTALANVIPDMRTLTSLHVGRNKIPQKEMRKIIAIAMRMDSMKILCEIPFKDKTLSELDVSGKNLGTEGALVITEYLDGNEAISSVNLILNYIPVEQAQELVKIMQSKEKLVTLCGLSKEETALDFSRRAGQRLRSGDAVLIANDISDMGAMLVLNLAGNCIGGHHDNYGHFIVTPEGIDFILLRIYVGYVTISPFSSALISQVLLLSPMPSKIWRRYRR
jgi:hypothetical protein